MLRQAGAARGFAGVRSRRDWARYAEAAARAAAILAALGISTAAWAEDASPSAGSFQPIAAPVVTAAFQDEPAPPTRLPETVVEGVQTQPVAPPTPAPPPPPPFDPYAGTIFDTPFLAQPVDGYVAPSSVFGTFSDTPLIDIPQSIQVVPRALIEDTQAFSVDQLYRFSSGLSNASTFNGLTSDYNIRGFANSGRRWNGFIDRSIRVQADDTANIERVEFLKGPASVLYGNSEPGGLLNMVTKKPFGENYTNLGITTGSWGLARLTADINRPLDADGDVMLRFNTAFQSADSFRDFIYDDRVVIAPVLSLRLTEDTWVTLEGSFFHYTTGNDTGIQPVDGDLRALPRSRNLNDPTANLTNPLTRTAIWLDHEINDNWHARAGFFGYFCRLDAPLIYAAAPPAPGGRTVPQVAFYGVDDMDAVGAQAVIVGKTEIAGRENELVAGMEYDYLDQYVFRAFSFTALPPLDVFDPQYAGGIPPGLPTQQSQSYNRSLGVFVQDAYWVTDRMRVMGGVRYDNNDNRAELIGTGVDVTNNDVAWTPRGAVIYDIVENQVATWYSYTEAFNAAVAERTQRRFSGDPFNPDGGPVSPERGKQHEIGLKFADEDGWWNATAAVFYIEKTSAITFGAPPGFVNQTGEARSQGFEFDFFGQLTDRWAMVANYAYTDARVIEDPNPAAVNTRLFNVPYNIVNVFTRYNLIERRIQSSHNRGRGVDEVLGVSYGVTWQSNATSTNPAVLLRPSYVVHNSGVYYQRGMFYSNLFVDNLFDLTYFTAGSSSGFTVGAPIGARVTFGLEF